MRGSNCSFPTGICGRTPFFTSTGSLIPRPALAVLAVVVVAGSVGFSAWWLARRRLFRSAAVTVIGRSVAAGVLAGLAMVPPGLLAKAAGYSVNVYGELLLRELLGRTLPSAMAVEHLLISVAMSVPFVAAATRWPGAHPLARGTGYGVLAWLSVNSFALPAAFGRPSPWALGLNAIWPSLLVHVVYGLALGAVTAWDADRKRSAATHRPRADPAPAQGRR